MKYECSDLIKPVFSHCKSPPHIYTTSCKPQIRMDRGILLMLPSFIKHQYLMVDQVSAFWSLLSDYSLLHTCIFFSCLLTVVTSIFNEKRRYQKHAAFQKKDIAPQNTHNDTAHTILKGHTVILQAVLVDGPLLDWSSKRLSLGQ